MNPDQLLAHYEKVADAPDAIPRLRRFILDLAVRGKLVAQEPDDEPASELLKRITGEKAQLAKAGKIKASRVRPTRMVDAPFDLPATWVWAPLGDVFLYDAGTKCDPKNLEQARWLLELEDIEKDSGRLLSRISVAEREPKSTKSEFHEGDILYGKLRPYLNKVLVADQPGYSTTEIVAIRPYTPLCSEYCALAFRRPDFIDYVTRLGQGTKMPRLRTEDAVVAPFPLPPLAEQRRIVARVDELMALCARLEAAREMREATRDRLAAASLARLNRPDPNPRTFRAHAAQTLEALAPLTTRPDQIKAFRQTILNLAVRGKLVEQDPADEPASALLKRVAKDIADYVRVNGGRGTNAEKILEEDQPFALPPRWAWTRLAGLCRVVTDGDHQPPPRSEDGVAFLTIGNVTTGRLDFAGCRRVPPEYFEALPAYRTPAVGDLLYTVVGATFGRPVLVDAEEPFCVQRHIAILKPSNEISVPFLHRVLASPFMYEQAAGATTGAAQPTIALKPLRNFLIPLPPLPEQHRIVAKVDALTALCDRLEAALTAADTTRARLLEALLHEALSPATAREMEAAE